MRLRRACILSVVENGGVTSCTSKPRGFSSSSEQPQQYLDLDVDKVAKILAPLLPNDFYVLFGDHLVIISASARSLVIISSTDFAWMIVRCRHLIVYLRSFVNCKMLELCWKLYQSLDIPIASFISHLSHLSHQKRRGR